jgi:hypothetical protein
LAVFFAAFFTVFLAAFLADLLAIPLSVSVRVRDLRSFDGDVDTARRKKNTTAGAGSAAVTAKVNAIDVPTRRDDVERSQDLREAGAFAGYAVS